MSLDRLSKYLVGKEEEEGGDGEETGESEKDHSEGGGVGLELNMEKMLFSEIAVKKNSGHQEDEEESEKDERAWDTDKKNMSWHHVAEEKKGEKHSEERNIGDQVIETTCESHAIEDDHGDNQHGQGGGKEGDK